MTPDSCPICKTPTRPLRGHRTLCLPCTEAEIGETVIELRDRVTAKIAKTAKKKWRR